jgi:hypothetical protein
MLLLLDTLGGTACDRKENTLQILLHSSNHLFTGPSRDHELLAEATAHTFQRT